MLTETRRPRQFIYTTRHNASWHVVPRRINRGATMTIDVFDETKTMTLREVADTLGVCLLTVRKWTHTGLRSVKCGAKTVTNMDEVNAFLNSKQPAKSKKVAATVAEIQNLIK